MDNIKAIIFDWARTLYDPETNQEFSNAVDILEYCTQKKYRLALVSLVTKKENLPGTSLETRNQQIKTSPLSKYFEKILTTEDDKNSILDETVKHFGLSNSEILIVDDRTIRGILYGNQRGISTVWLRRGKFANELPNEETGQPTYTIHSLTELKNIL
jgi:FMN phosphatase YigB (HAD superfamily)